MILTEQQKREQIAERLRRIHEAEERKRQPEKNFEPTHKGSHLRIDEIYTLPSTFKNGEEIRGRSMAKCTCRCGNKVEYPLTHVVKKGKTHCGCRTIDVAKRAEQEYEQNRRLATNVKDITGKIYGYLFVESYAGTVTQSSRKRSAWNVRCACGCVMVLDAVSLQKRKNPHCNSKICRRLYDDNKTREQAKTMIAMLIEKDYAWKQVLRKKQMELDQMRERTIKRAEERHKWKEMISK